MFVPPLVPVTVRGSMWGPLSAYAVVIAALGILVSGLARGSMLNAVVVAVIGVAVFGALIFTATGARVDVSDTELVVARRWRPTWRVSLEDFRYVSENVPARPKLTFLAGWTFRTGSGTEAKLEISMFAPADRRRLRKVFADVIVDADIGMNRR